MNRFFVIAFWFTVLVLGLLLSIWLCLPTVIIGFEGGFRWRQMRSEVSPDGQFEMIVAKRVAFPANEWIDPEVVVRAELRKVSSRHVLASERIVLLEDSDWSAPGVQWFSDRALVSGCDKRMHQTLTLRPRP